jgi:hypothetical protein
MGLPSHQARQNRPNSDVQVGHGLRRFLIEQFDFHFAERGLHVTPIDYNAIINDVYFKNIVDYRLAALRGNQLVSCASTIKEIREVLDPLEKELN